MYSIKEISTWYNVHHHTMAKRLLELGVITKKGMGKRHQITLSKLQPLFKECGMPKNLSLTLPLFQ